MPLVRLRCCHQRADRHGVTSHYAVALGPARAVPATGANQAQGMNEP
jgi:hypothetical protein